MANFSKKTNRFEIIIVALIYLAFIVIGILSYRDYGISVENSKQILSSLDKKRVMISENIESDYIIDNYIYWYGKYKKKRHEIPNNFTIYKEIFVSGKRIISIYKKI